MEKLSSSVLSSSPFFFRLLLETNFVQFFDVQFMKIIHLKIDKELDLIMKIKRGTATTVRSSPSRPHLPSERGVIGLALGC